MAEGEKTLILLKPSAVRRGLVGRLLARFEDKGMGIVALKKMRLGRERAERFYSVHEGKPFYEDLVETVSGGDIVATILEGREAVSVVRKMIGATDPVEAAPGTVRGDYGFDLTDNLIHASDSEESFRKEVAVVFPGLGV